MKYLKSILVILAAISASVAFAAKPGSEPSGPQDVNVINSEISVVNGSNPLDVNVISQASGEIEYVYAGHTSTIVPVRRIMVDGVQLCASEFTGGKISTGKEIRKAIDTGTFEIPDQYMIFTRDDSLDHFISSSNYAYHSFLKVMHPSQTTEPGWVADLRTFSSSYVVACSVPSP